MRKEQIGDATLCLGDKRKLRGKAHPLWKGDAISEKGGRKRALRMYPEIGPCVSCGSGKAERHHADGDTSNNEPGNIVALCRRCHTIEHGKAPSREIILLGVKAAAESKRAITHCPQDHPYSGENLYVYKDGRRACKECRREARRRYRAGGGRG